MSAALSQYSIPDLNSMLANQVESVVAHLLPNGRREGSEWCVGSVEGEAGNSLKVHLSGAKAGVWKDFSCAGDMTGDLVELWAKCKGIEKSSAIREIKQYLGITNGKPALSVVPPKSIKPQAPEKPDVPMKKISAEYHRSLIGNLKKNEAALAYLKGEKRGLNVNTIDYFGLGLSARYQPNGKETYTEHILQAPMRSLVDGTFLNKNGCINVPGVSVNPTDGNSWMSGKPRSYYSDKYSGQKYLFVCEGLKDVWRHWQALHEAGMDKDFLLVSSTHGSAFPAEWKSPEFWKTWDRVYLGQDSDEPGNDIAEKLIEHIGREVFRVAVPKNYGKDWTDFWQNHGTIEEFRTLIDEAPVASGASIKDRENGEAYNIVRIGRFSHNPVDINGTYITGHLYYPTETHLIENDPVSGTVVEKLDTILIRSDRSQHRSCLAPAPAGTAQNKRVLKLTDGTIIEKEPSTSHNHSWHFSSIKSYLEGGAKPRKLDAIMNDVIEILKRSVWLPYAEDYIALALTVPVTYMQWVFESVPLILMNGAAGTGKSQTGHTMAKLCCNGVVIGQVSAATAARIIDQTRGFVVMDDVESIAQGKDANANELIQGLKVSYNKHTGVKFWTDVKTMKVEKLNFYGVKLISNTLGADEILGTRMIRIQTRKMPDGMPSTVSDFTPKDFKHMAELRNELHVWAFENVQKVEKAYRSVYATKTDRHAEIAAPLRAMAKIVEIPEISEQLEKCLTRQERAQKSTPDDPVEVLKEAIRNLIKQGFDTVTLTHMRLETRVLLDANYGMTNKNEIPVWDDPKWIGKQLRANDMVEEGDHGRERVQGQNLRLVKFSDWLVTDTLKGDYKDIEVGKRKAADFCRGCAQCPYNGANCELMAARMQKETTDRKIH